ncbi:ornithine cyclodeaminase family protein [Mangrovicoccus algicola]|uniref:Ornithine cyclodeaminase family protein n=1 Tax=Mangrovicoccus algicola TaxID=2771008 RepID=A0A8J7CZN7_9RHOB|nr:ornithine cyclodeaminase family protein [Mangrovicoccus algicola]MBE3638173.1 ornithine cyclodeaminase family protein [Mangrovicoccus algicola]
MHHYTDDQIAGCLSPAEAETCLAAAFRAFGRGEAAVQDRIRTEAGGVKLSTMGAVLPGTGVAGAKVYTTIAGQFSFVILLFCAETGRPLATMEANAITAIRSPAASVLAARHLARPDSRVLAVFGTGVQGRAHLAHFAAAYPLTEALVVSRRDDPALAAALSEEAGLPVRMCIAAEAAARADILVTATRSAVPVLSGRDLRPGQFIAAMGSSLPHTRELDDAALSRAAVLAMDWIPQTSREAGDIVMADPAALARPRQVDLKDLAAGLTAGRGNAGEIAIFKSVGTGLQDIAVAAAVHARLSG